MDNFKEDVIKANEDEFVVDWISREEEQKQYEEVMYEKGITQGIEQNKQDNARKMLELNMDLDVISKITGLTIKQINDLK
ncbi:MAG TPA: hypothetical protein IAC20_01460 [Candidatus Faecisoma merdavium]|nr:hypothetical protein [Candidatus Faecisoma merdavium]